MNDPYTVLGIAHGADEETIKKAYRQKCKQYHPDLHPNDPDCEEKFKEVQAAYSAIMHPQSSSNYGGGTAGGAYQNPFSGFGFGGYGPFGFGSYGTGGQSGPNTYDSSSPELQAAGNYIRSGYYREALNVLDGMPQSQRSAQWHYYAALACNGLGNNIRALDEARTAADMEPGNYQYQNLLSRLQGTGQAYTSYQRNYSQPGAPTGNRCLSFWMYMMLCNLISLCCCGGRGGFLCC